MFNIKNLTSGYESDNYKLRYSISTILIKTFLTENKYKTYEATANIIDVMKKDNLLSYVYVKNNTNDEIILGKEDFKNSSARFDAKTQIKQITKNMGNHTIYIGIPVVNNLQIYYTQFLDMILKILSIFFAIGINFYIGNNSWFIKLCLININANQFCIFCKIFPIIANLPDIIS